MNRSILSFVTPYGTSACKWDSVLPITQLWNEYERLIKPSGAIVLFGSEPFSSHMRLSNQKLYKYDWVWEKSNGANFLNVKYQPFKVHENIMVFGKMATSYSKKGNMVYYPQMGTGKPYKQCQQENPERKDHKLGSSIRSHINRNQNENDGTRYPRSVLRFQHDAEKLHPTQKPVALIEYLVRTYSREGETVLDNCMGSGTTGVACAISNRDFIGIEKDENYFNIAKKRIESCRKRRY